ncbi:MAG: DUF3160 domain-containing protein, partial [Anaerolineales bacterium]|nr:DUF3160 domain-containing protein [Anaerolineales bacterium]
MQKKPFVRLLLFLMLVVLIVACRDETPEEAATLPSATAVATATTPVEATPLPLPTVPPALTPTIVIPTVEPEPGETATPQPPAPETNLPEALRFATFRETAVDTIPAIFHHPIAPDLSNVTVPFVLSQEQLDRLAADGLVVSPGVEKEFFTVYEQARYANVPTFITSDSLLHVYHLLF